MQVSPTGSLNPRPRRSEYVIVVGCFSPWADLPRPIQPSTSRQTPPHSLQPKGGTLSCGRLMSIPGNPGTPGCFPLKTGFSDSALISGIPSAEQKTSTNKIEFIYAFDLTFDLT